MLRPERMLDDQFVRLDDLMQLDQAVRESAVVLEDGEVLWPLETVDDAIDGLARLGRVILGVDARERDDAGLATEVPISDYQPHQDATDVERGRQEAHDAVGRAERVTGWTQPLIGAIIEQIMRSRVGQVVTNTEVQAAAAEAGHDFDGEQVRNTLSYMHRKGILVKGETRGTWLLPTDDQPESTNDFGPASEAGPREASDDIDPRERSVIAGTLGVSQPAR